MIQKTLKVNGGKMATYHTNRRIKWDDFGMAHHANGRTAFSLGIAYHANGRTAYSLGVAYHDNGRTAHSLGVAYHANGRTAYSLGVAYHDNGRTAYSLGSFYDKAGKIIPGKSTFSVTLGPGIVMHLIPNFKITVYDRKIS